MKEGTIQRQIIWLMILRVVIITTLMGTLLVIQLSPEGAFIPSFNFIYLLAGITYGLNLLYLALYRVAGRLMAYVYLQLFGDVAIETGIVFYTGGVESPFTFLYLLSIIAAVIMLYRRGGLIIASLCGIAYGTLVDLFYLGLIKAPGGQFQPVRSIGYHYLDIFLHFFAFYVVAFLVSYLSENLRRTGSKLEEQRSHLADLQAYNELVINSMSSGLITLDLEGRITKVNQVALRITAYLESDLLGRELFKLVGLDPRLLSFLKRRLRDQRLYRFDLRVTSKNGVEMPVGVSISSLVDKSRQPLGYIVNFQDLTELRKLEDELRLKDRLALVGSLAASVAHEIRNPLASISGSVQLLGSDGVPGEEEKHLLAIIQRESRRLDRTIQDFLTFTRPSSMERQRIDLSVLIRDTVTLLRNSEELHPDHEIALDLPADDVFIQADSDRIHQVIWNVCRNGLSAMAGGGILTIRLAGAGKDSVDLEFLDQGHGFGVERGAKIFEPFSGRFKRGTGLGLAIVYKIVRAHGGRVTVRNTEPGGAAVTIRLPVEGVRPVKENGAEPWWDMNETESGGGR